MVVVLGVSGRKKAEHDLFSWCYLGLDAVDNFGNVGRVKCKSEHSM